MPKPVAVKKRAALLLAVMATLLNTAISQVRYANQVFSFSSQYNPGNWSAAQVLGIPNVYPSCGDNAQAWASASADGAREFLQLGFPDPAPINKIQIYETLAPGAIDTVYVFNPTTSSYQAVWSATAAPAPCPRVLTIRFPTTSFDVDKIRIAVNSPAVGNWNEIDAVGVSLIGNGGTIGNDQSICGGQKPAAISNIDSAFNSAGAVAYQWQDSTAGGHWANVATAGNGVNYTPPAISQTTYYRRKATQNGATAYSNTVGITYTPAGDPGLFPQNAWNFYSYSSNAIDLNNSVYLGYYTLPDLNFNTQANWNAYSSPSAATGYIGCTVPIDYFTVAARRKGFPAGPYTMVFNNYDDQVQVYKNGRLLVQNPGGNTLVALGFLDQDSTLEIRLWEYNGPAYMAVTFSLTPLNGGEVGASQVICVPETPAAFTNVKAAYGGASPNTIHYQWQDSTNKRGWQAISSATAVTYQAPPVTDTTWYRRMASDAAGGNAFSNVLSIIPQAVAGDTALVPVNMWNEYGFSGRNINLNSSIVYRGYDTLKTLAFDTRTHWDGYASPSASASWKGCTLPADNFTLVFKRKGFPDSINSLRLLFHDDEINVYKNGRLYFSAGCCNSNALIALGKMATDSILEIRLGEVGGFSGVGVQFLHTPLSPGSITGSQTICLPGNASALSSTAAADYGNAPASIHYQWQDSSLGSNWHVINGATGLTYTPTALTDTTWFRRVAIDSEGDLAYSNVVVVNASSPAGNPSVAPQNTWNFYAFNGRNIDLTNVQYYGYYSRSTLNFATTSDWNASSNPSTTAGYKGCGLGDDNFTLVAKRRGFPTGNYILNILAHDDEVRVYVNGVKVFEHLNCCDSHSNISLGALTDTSVMEFRLGEVNSVANLNISFTTGKLNSGSIGSSQVICASGDPTVLTSVENAFGGASPNTISYRWQDSVANGSWQFIAGATGATYDPPVLSASTWFRRVAVDNTPDTAYSNAVGITIEPVQGNPAVAGSNAWNVYAFNGNSLNPVNTAYRGYYVDSSLNIDTRNRWNAYASPSAASNYQGCPVSNDLFAYILKRTGFPTGKYTISIPSHDDSIRILVNGNLLYQAACCNTNPTTLTGVVLNSSSTVEIRMSEFNGPAFLVVNFVNDLQGQTISFDPVPDKIYGDAPFKLHATASSGLPVSFTVKSGLAIIDANNYVTLTGAGTVTIEAAQAGNGNYSAAPPLSQTFTVYKAAQSISFTADSSANGYILNAASSVGLPVSFAVSGNGSVNGNVLTFTGAGLVTVTASNTGNQNYVAASAVKTFCILAPSPGGISGYRQPCPGSQSYGVAALPNVQYKWTISGGGTITSSATANTVIVNWTTPGDYTLTVAAYTSCDTVNKQYSNLPITVMVNNLPAAPTNLYPANGTLVSAFPFSLSWKPVGNAQLYDVYIWKNGLAQPSTPAASNLAQIGLAVTPGLIANLSPGTTYNWRVVAKNGCGSNNSVVNNFIVSDLPNLKVRKVTVAPSVFAGTGIDVSAEVINIGNAATGEAHWTDAVYLSDDTLVGNDIYLGGKGNVRALAPNEFYENVIRVQLPYNIQIGKWYILVRTNTINGTLGETTITDNTGVDSLQIKTPDVPDLKMQVPVTLFPSEPFSGQPLQIHYTVKNGGTADALYTHWNDYIYLSPDSGLNINNINTASRIGIISYNGGVLKKDSFYTVNATVNLPVRLFGRLFVYVVANAESSFYELFRNDNLRQTQAFTITLTPPPDFVITDMSSPATAAGGERITVAWDVKNAGASAPNRQETLWSDAVYFSTDSVFDFSTATFLGRNSTLPLPSMNVGESYHHSLDVNIPGNAPDSGYLFVYTDVYNQIFEYNKEDNNIVRRKIKIKNPDLVIDSIAVTDSALAGTVINVEYRLKNTGSGKAFSINRLDKFWLSSNPVYTANQLIPLSAPTLAHALDTAGSVLLSQSVTIPESFAGPTGYIYVDADYRNDLPEANEANNRIRSNPIRITLTPVTYPDLAPSNLQLATAALLTDQTYTLTYTVTNNSPVDILARTWKDAIYISTNPVWSIGTAKRIRDIPQSMTLLQGASYDVTDSIRVDLSTLNGADSNRYYVFVFTDADNAITEQTTSNNTARSSQVSLYHLPFPDLTVTQASGADSATSGGRILITYTVKNTGGTYGLSPYWYDGVYFSKDAFLDGSDQLAAGSRVITTPLASGDSYQLSIYVTVPTGISGAYYLLMTTDHSGLNKDQNRNNNYKVVAVKIGNQTMEGPVYVTPVPPSDLVATILQSPSVSVAGQPVTVKWKVLNQQHVTNKTTWLDKIVLSGDDKVDNSDPVLFTYARSGKLDSVAYYIDSAQVFLPATAAGNAYLLLKADAADGVYESDEANNTAASLIFITQPAPSDLIVANVSVPDSAVIGDSAVVTWIVKNIGANPATGTIRQGIYFYEDSVWSDSAVLVYSQWDQINLPPLGIDTFVQKIKIKSVDAGAQYAIVRTDLLNNIPEGDEQNNTTAAAQSTLLTVPRLQLNVRTVATLKNDDELYYRIEVPDSLVGGAILLSLSGDSIKTTNELYARFGHLPSRIAYDLAFDRSASGSQQIVIPDLKKGTYYILAYGHSGLHNTQPVSLLAEVIDFKIRSVFTNTGGNTGLVTVKISGARFEAGMQAQLLNNTADSVSASRIIFQNSTLLYATFNLAGRKTGQYTLRLVKMNNDTASLVNGFSIVAGTAGSVAGNSGPPGFYCHIQNIDADDLMDLRSNYPPSVVQWRLYATDIVYGNSGNIDIPIRDYILTCLTNLPVSEDPTVIMRALAQLLSGQLPSTLLQIFMTLRHPDIPDVIPPGYQGSRRFYSALPSVGEFHYRLLEK